MTQNVSRKTVLYGDVIDAKGCRQIEDASVDQAVDVTWRTEPILFDPDSGVSLVFVDLDDPALGSPEFLMSVATAGQGVTVVGKANEPTLDLSQRLSKFGVAEIMQADECLVRLHDFLQELETCDRHEKTGPSKYSIEALIGISPQIAEIRKTIKALSQVDFPSALFLGETGSGKSLIFKILHHTGMRSGHNLVEVNCSAIPDELFESELFGHARGAFTDAKKEKMGLFEYAQDGTLFLDEVGNLSRSAQAKLLKILEDKKLRKIGDVEEYDINVRVVTATNLDLERAIADNTFREDLYYRLNLLMIHVPPLRERTEDIPGTVEHFLKFYSTLYGKPDLAIDDKAVGEMLEYSWPGNTRELSNVIERAVLLSRRRLIHLKDIKAALSNSQLTPTNRHQIAIDVPPQGIPLSEIEQNVVLQVLNMCRWNKTEAAKFLEISRPRLRRIIADAEVEQNRRVR